MPPVVEQVGSAGSGMQLSSNSGSPVSGAGDGPIGAATGSVPDLPAAVNEGMSPKVAAYDSSDDEDTHRPPSPEREQRTTADPLPRPPGSFWSSEQRCGPASSNMRWTISCTSTLPGSRAPRRGCGYRSWNCEGYVGDYVRSSEITRDL